MDGKAAFFGEPFWRYKEKHLSGRISRSRDEHLSSIMESMDWCESQELDIIVRSSAKPLAVWVEEQQNLSWSNLERTLFSGKTERVALG